MAEEDRDRPEREHAPEGHDPTHRHEEGHGGARALGDDHGRARPGEPAGATVDQTGDESREELRRTGRWVVVGGALLVAVCAAAVVVKWLANKHTHAREEASRSAEADKGPVVLVTRVTVSPGKRDVTLTADVRSLYQTTLYAKVAGYVSVISVDKGDRVKRGQVLGVVESPETDQAVVAAKSSDALREKLAARARRLAPAVVSQQDLDTANANLDEALAGLKSARAMQDYEAIRAPFDGVITARYVDPGALMPAATAGTQSALPFVDMVDPDTLRVDAYVGQDFAVYVKDGDPVTIRQEARPGLVVHASVTRTSSSLDTRSRTMLVEAQVDNRPYGMLPGTFAAMSLHVETPPRPVVPAEALLSRDGQNMVARVDAGHVHLIPVTLGLIDAKTVQIEGGVVPGDVVALNLPTEVDDGGAVQTKEKPAAPPDETENRGGARAGGEGSGSPAAQGDGQGKASGK